MEESRIYKHEFDPRIAALVGVNAAVLADWINFHMEHSKGVPTGFGYKCARIQKREIRVRYYYLSDEEIDKAMRKINELDFVNVSFLDEYYYVNIDLYGKERFDAEQVF